MHRGPPASGIHRAGISALFLLPRGCPRRFAPKLDPAVAVEAEGSICLGGVEEEVALEEELGMEAYRADVDVVPPLMRNSS
jgi:hypothetical protein